MKLKANVKIENKEELVNLLTTALYGSYWAGVDYPEDLKKHKSEFKEPDDCLEDILAKWLLRNPENYIIIYDIESNYDNESNSKLGEDYFQLTLSKLEEAWAKVLMDYKGNFPTLDEMDLDAADEILQTACMGEVIFG